MSQTIKLKRSAVAGKVPTTSSLDLGEIALNTYDGKAYLKKNDGSESVQTLVVTDSTTTGSINISGNVSASAFSGSFFGNGTGLTRNMAVTGSDVFGNQFEDHVSVLHFDSDTGINVSASAPNTAFIKLGSHFRDFFVDGSATIVATGSDQMDIISNGGLDISTSLTDTNGNGVSKELIFAVDATVARTGSNTFTADQTIQGKVTSSTLDTSGNAIIRGDLDVIGDINISGEIDGHISVTPVASDSNNSNGVVIQDLTFDGFGHTRTLGTVNLDDRYFTETEADNRFVNVTGDSISGSLIVSASGATDDFKVGDSKLFVSASGNVGIGTTSPSATLTVTGNQLFDGTGINLKRTGVLSGRTWNLGVDSNGLSVYDIDSSSYRLTIDETGNVGIGTTSPTAKFDVAGSVQIGAASATPNVAYGLFGYTGVGLGIYSAASGGTQGIGFWLNNGSAYEAGRWLSNGNLGIGTTSPAEKLTVAGSISASGAIVLEDSQPIKWDTNNILSHNGTSTYLGDAASASTLTLSGGNGTFEGDLSITGGDITLGTDSIASNINAVGDVLAFKVDSNENTGGTPNIQFKVGAATELTIDGSTATFAGDIDLTAGQLELRGDVALDHDGSSLYVKAPSSIFFYPGNSNKANINSSGNFTLAGNLDINGTGTSTIDGNLTVGGTVTAQEFHTEFVSASIIYQSGSTKFGDTSDDVHSFSGSLRVTGSGDHYFTDGRVGIGTTSPGTVLDIHGTGNVLHVGTGTIEAQYMSFRGSGASGAYIGYDGTGMLLQPGDGKRFLIRGGNATWGSGTVGLLVDTSGNVGIGTTSPSYKLQVHGDAAFLSAAGSLNGLITQGSEGKGRLYLYDAGSPTIGLQTNGNSFFNSGNVGIGTSSPSAKLDIKGDGADFFLQSNDFKIARIQPRGTGADLDKGLFSLFDGSTEDVRIDTSGNSWFNGGNVGIGTTSPTGYTDATTLEIKGKTGTGVGLLKVTNANNAVSGAFYAGSSVLVLNAQTNHPLGLNTNNTERMRIDSSGNVGIGTTSPAYKLDVNGSAVRFTRSSKYLIMNPNFASANTHSDIQTDTDMGLSLTTSGTERLRIDSSGNVGIGTTSPSAKLHINSSVSDGIILRTTANVEPFIAIQRNSGTNGVAVLRSIDGGHLYVDTGATGAAQSTKMTIAAGGNVGIGTTSPSYALDIERTSGEVAIQLQARDNSSNSSLYFGDNADADVGSLIYNHGSNYMTFTTNASERMRIDSSGNVMVGKTATGLGNQGAELSATGQLKGTAANQVVAYLNRTSSDGTIAEFRKDNTAVGSIGTAGGNLTVNSEGAGGYGRLQTEGTDAYIWYSGAFYPASNNSKDLGTSSLRFKDLHLGGHAKIDTALTASGLIYPTSDGTANQVIGTDGSGNLSFISPGAATAFPYVGDAVITGSLIVSASGATNDFQVGDDKLFVSASGNIGIGTVNPDTGLDVTTVIRSRGGFVASPTEVLPVGIANYLSNFNNYTGLLLKRTGTGAGDFIIGQNNSGVQQFSIQNDGSAYFAGNVGIGTTTPTTKLEIRKDSSDTTLTAITSTNDTISLLNETDTTNNYTSIGFVGNAAEITARIASVADASNGRGNLVFLTGDSSSGTPSERMRINSSGNVGIGTASPASISSTARWLTLDADNGSSASGGIIHQVNGTTKGALYVYNDNVYHDAKAGVGHIFAVDNGTEAMRINSSANVGIGTTSPTAKLHVSDASGITIENTATTNVQLKLRSNGVDTWRIGQNLVVTGATALEFYDDVNNVDRMVITNTGNVGIGTTSPEALLQVENSNGGGAVQIGRDTGANQYQYINFGGNSAGDAAWQIGKNLNSNNSIGPAKGFYLYDLASSTSRLVVDTSGNVGIGTTSPNGIFHIYGNASTYVTNQRSATKWSEWHVGSVDHALFWDSTADMRFMTETGLGGSGGSEKMRITSGGNVGIGTPSPLEKLHVMYTDTDGIATVYSKGVIEDTDAQLDLLSTSDGTWGSSINLVEAAGGGANTDVWSIVRQTTGGTGDSSLRFNFGTVNNHLNTNRVLFSSTGDVTIANDLTVGGKVTAQEFHTEFVSASIIYQSGSTKFGDTSDDVHSFSGSLRVTGSGDHYFTDGNVGIGTDSPSYPLTVKVDSATGIKVLHSNDSSVFQVDSFGSTGTDAGALLRMYNEAGDATVQIDTRSGGTRHTYFNNGGNVGIGTTSPSYPLEVDTGAGTFSVRAKGGSSVTLASDASLTYFGSTHEFYNAAGSSEYMRINSSGNVGIGTTSPSYALEVQGDSTTGVLAVQNASNGRDTFRSMNAAGVRTTNLGNDASGHGLIIGRNSSGVIKNYIAGDGDSYFTAGNVGIGTTSPAHKLDLSDSSTTWAAKILNTNANGQGLLVRSDTTNDDSILGVYGNGSYRMIVKGDGNVGIGTNSPSAPLHLSSSEDRLLLIQSSDANAYLAFQDTDSSSAFANRVGTVSDGLYFNTGGGGERMRIDSSGTIKGTGTYTAGNSIKIFEAQRLGGAVAGDWSYDDATTDMSLGTSTAHSFSLKTSNTRALTIESGGALTFPTISSVTSTGASISHLSSNGYLYIKGGAGGLVLGDDSTASRIQIEDNSNIRLETAGSERMRIDSGGSVGIGTTSPDLRFSVVTSSANSSAARIGGLEYAGNQRGLTIKTFQSVGGDDCGVEFNAAEGVAGYGSFVFKADTSERMRIDSSGNVGIGTTSPYSKLQLHQSAAGAPLRLRSESGNSGNVGMMFSVADNTVTTDAYQKGAIYFQGDGTGNAVGDLVFAVNNAISSTNVSISDEKLRIKRTGEITMPGNLTVGGIVTAQEFHTEFVSASIIYQSGSTKFGDTSDDVHEFSGSLRVSGSGDHYFSNGNVGIGTTTPTSKLEISTTDGTESLRINNSDFTLTDGELVGEILFTSNDTTLNADRKVVAGIKSFAAENFSGANANEASLQFFTANATDLRNSATPTPRMIIDEVGKVGIGTTSPGTKLHVKDSSAGAGVVLKVENAGANGAAQLDLTNDAQSWFVNTRTDDKFSIYNNTASTTALTIDTSDNVGIGTISPTEKLEVTGNAILDASNANLKIKAGVTGTKGDIQWTFNTDSTVYASAGIEYDNRGTDGFLIDSGYPITMDFNSSYIRWRYQGSEKMRLNTSGNLGIGTTSPSANLHVVREITTTGIEYPLIVSGQDVGNNIDQGTDSGIGIKFEIAGNDTAGDSLVGASIVAMRESATDADSSTGLAFLVSQNDTTLDEAVRIDQNGNVGIGTVSPNSLLHVDGDMSIQGAWFWYSQYESTSGAGVSNGFTVEWRDNITALSSTYMYKVRLTTAGTGTNSGATYIVNYNPDTTSWEVRAVNISGNTSNYPLLAESSGTLVAYTNHANSYPIRVLTESYLCSDNDGTFHNMGADFHWQRSVNTLFYNDGDVGIGTTNPSTKLEVNGTATVTSLVETSTRELKKDITELEDQSSIVDSLQPVTYTWKESEEEDFGLIAEDVEEIAPHLVHRDLSGKPTGIKYSKLSVLLLDVVQRQSTLIEDLNERITKLENERGN